jgi:hypothetical protein
MTDYLYLWHVVVVGGTIYALLFLGAAKIVTPERFRHRVNMRLLIKILSVVLALAIVAWVADIFLNPTP